MGFVVFCTLPGLVILLTAVAFADQFLRLAGRGRGNRQSTVSATGFEQLHAAFSPGKVAELKQRQSALLMRDDEEDGAPPRCTSVDLEGGTVVVRLPAP
ncbi:DUF6191 domain-containing protein [Streptomyces beijiangensis]|uniref:Uncharacterized protein n=1 Tax=Streptomyces beijiangensis TaxID=163361 RepID=A0A939JLG2_9ACTN|nr:DUF6191 domain-containing protein [Streptomyces beijiangensis]MBO0515704.1 hypothetical protein [Streptomyces beijiangensis]